MSPQRKHKTIQQQELFGGEGMNSPEITHPKLFAHATRRYASHTKIKAVEAVLDRLEELIVGQSFEQLETDTLEIKPTPSEGQSWKERYRSACAFLNTRGGIFILGIKEEGSGAKRRYVFSGWRPDGEEKLAQMPEQFTTMEGEKLDLRYAFPPFTLLPFMDGHVAVVLVDELVADEKYVFYGGAAYKRVLTGDHKIAKTELGKQLEYREEARLARELQVVPGVTLGDLDLNKINEYITFLNQPIEVQTLKPDLKQARSFLEANYFLHDGKVTLLGALVCAREPEKHLGFRCQLDGYVDTPFEIARDTQHFEDNILALMQHGYSYLLRNIRVGISVAHGGSSLPEYPLDLVRETVNNALAHRDYCIDRPVILVVKPGERISISNPGRFRPHLLIEAPNEEIPVHRIIPEAKPRNPKLAHVLRVFRKWEGRGIGMGTMVNLCLKNEIDLPYYIFGTEEVTLRLSSGKLLDERMEELFNSFDRYIEEKLGGNQLTMSQKLVLSYLMKSEWANAVVRYTILMSPNNNHFGELTSLERHGLIFKHSSGSSTYPVYVVDRTLMKKTFNKELRIQFGDKFDSLDNVHKSGLNVVYRHYHFSKKRTVSAKAASFELWSERGGSLSEIKEFDAFYRQMRRVFEKLKKFGFIIKPEGAKGYVLNLGGDHPLREKSDDRGK